MTDYYPEGGFYEQRAKQGESEWEDDAQFDPPAPSMTEDMRRGGAGQASTSNVSLSDLTKEDSYAFESGKVYGS